MKPTFGFSRRDFLRTGCRTVTAIGSAAALGQMGRISAFAQGADYKALVCVFLFGGNDANNVVVPVGAGYTPYKNVRQNLAIPEANLLAINSSKGTFGLHPSMTALHALYTSTAAVKPAAILANVGTLVKPTNRQQYLGGQYPVPLNLFSHSDQTQQWQNAAPQGGQPTITGTGWSGRIADHVQLLNGVTAFPAAIGVSGNALQLIGQQTQPTTISGSNFGLDGSDHTPASDARDASLQEMLLFDSGVTLVHAASGVLKASIDVAKLADQATQSAPPLNTVFPQTGLGQQLAQVAKIIQVRTALGMRRQIFFCSLGGFDTHSDQLAQQVNLLRELSDAMAAFYAATGEMGVQNQVTTFTESEFSRTFQPNGTAGTDHAWGSHAIILGGAVKGGDIYGSFPTLALSGPDDSGGRGNWIPTTALDQYGAALATWFGVSAVDLPSIFPNIGNFPAPLPAFI